MRISFKSLRRLGLGLIVILGVIATILWVWVIPRAIVAAIRERYDGHVTIAGWWVNGSSAGVTGLTMHETSEPSSPAWLVADRVATDLNLWGMLRGRFAPRRIVLRHPSIVYRIDAEGHPLTQILLRHSGSGPIPELIAEDGRLAMRQTGRSEMLVTHLGARMRPDDQGPKFEVRADDPAWGHPTLNGRFSPDLASSQFVLTADRLVADRDKELRIPFVDPNVWQFFNARGPIGIVLDCSQPPKGSGPLRIETTVIFQKTHVFLPSLDLVADEATGRALIHDKIVDLSDVEARLIGGHGKLAGRLDFTNEVVRYHLSLGLDGVDLDDTPASWDLDRRGVKGRITGTAALRMSLSPSGLDLTGSSASGRIDGAVVQGIPLQQLMLTFRGEGLRPIDRPAGAAKGPFLPQWLGVDFHVGDVELKPALARFDPDGSGHPSAVPVSGRLGLEGNARLPLGSLDDLKVYTVRGSADLAGASIGGLDLGRLMGRLDLREGVLELADLRGRLVDRPEGHGPPTATDPPPAEGPLPPGGFRGRVRADLAADRKIQLNFDGVELPVRDLVAAASSRDLPISGRLTIQATAEARGRELADARIWTLTGRARAPEVTYRKSTIRDVSTTISIEHGRLTLADVSARLGDATLKGRLGIELAAPWAYEGELDTGVLPLSELLSLLPHVPADFPVSGTVAGRGAVRGAVHPLRIESSGEARIAHFQAGRVPIGDLPIRWSTQGETILLSADEVQRYGGEIKAEARVPVHGDKPIEGTITLARVDTAELSAEAPQSWKLTGRADGKVRFRLRPGSGGKVPDLDADGQLSAADLTVRSFDLQAESLGGSIQLKGDARIGADPKDDEIHADLKAIAVRLYKVWGALGTTGGLTELRGRAFLDGQLKTHADLKDVRARAKGDLEELIWGYNYPLGRLHADLSFAPEGWRIGPLSGELWGSRVKGEGVTMDRLDGGRSRFGVDVRLDRIALNRGLAFWPDADRRFAGFGALRVTGKSDDSPKGRAEFRVERGSVNGLELTELRVPADWYLTMDGAPRGALEIRRGTGKLAGGTVGGDAWIALGARRDFRAKLFVDDVDLRVISRDEMANRSVPGRISGFMTVSGSDPLQPAGYRGELDFDLVQASIGDIPLLDELDRSLGSAEGGVFDEGDFHGIIADQRIRVDRLTLVGPLAQIHATGTVDFDGRLNLAVVVNTNRGIPQTGQAFLAQAPNVAEAVAQRAAAIDQVADFVSSRLLKFRITGTIRDPNVTVDQSINARGAIGFFIRAARLSIQSPSRRDAGPR
jgi:translocation and assembly module TamB